MFSHELVFTLVPGSMQVTHKKYLILITYLSKIECISQGHRQKKGKQKHIKDKKAKYISKRVFHSHWHQKNDKEKVNKH